MGLSFSKDENLSAIQEEIQTKFRKETTGGFNLRVFGAREQRDYQVYLQNLPHTDEIKSYLESKGLSVSTDDICESNRVGLGLRLDVRKDTSLAVKIILWTYWAISDRITFNS